MSSWLAASTVTSSITRFEVFKFLVVISHQLALSVDVYVSPVFGSVRRGDAKL